MFKHFKWRLFQLQRFLMDSLCNLTARRLVSFQYCCKKNFKMIQLLLNDYELFLNSILKLCEYLTPVSSAWPPPSRLIRRRTHLTRSQPILRRFKSLEICSVFNLCLKSGLSPSLFETEVCYRLHPIPLPFKSGVRYCLKPTFAATRIHGSPPTIWFRSSQQFDRRCHSNPRITKVRRRSHPRFIAMWIRMDRRCSNRTTSQLRIIWLPWSLFECTSLLEIIRMTNENKLLVCNAK